MQVRSGKISVAAIAEEATKCQEWRRPTSNENCHMVLEWMNFSFLCRQRFHPGTHPVPCSLAGQRGEPAKRYVCNPADFAPVMGGNILHFFARTGRMW